MDAKNPVEFDLQQAACFDPEPFDPENLTVLPDPKYINSDFLEVCSDEPKPKAVSPDRKHTESQYLEIIQSQSLFFMTMLNFSLIKGPMKIIPMK